ncbi:hypothetical protein BLNAU_4578 [Blattamonas nauphoetae]|uniref:Uncharacterized protein n=1 Tax=Blattamonas nauphoetae TaxID=2049346 RepID=A0ABQ9Y9D9_9EUKA|nr:hypothetical protein BLNAU_4578 [Blattamonas nauphoetae]
MDITTRLVSSQFDASVPFTELSDISQSTVKLVVTTNSIAIFIADDIMALGMIVTLPNVIAQVCCVRVVVFMCLTVIPEEESLEERFGMKYCQYKANGRYC